MSFWSVLCMVYRSEDAAEQSTECLTVWVLRLVSRCYLTLIKLERKIPRSIPPFKSLCGYAQWCFDSPIDSKSATVLWQVMSIIDVCTEVRRLWPRNQDLIVLGKINKVSRKVLALKTPYASSRCFGHVCNHFHRRQCHCRLSSHVSRRDV
jgi:hypothetical protein